MKKTIMLIVAVLSIMTFTGCSAKEEPKSALRIKCEEIAAEKNVVEINDHIVMEIIDIELGPME